MDNCPDRVAGLDDIFEDLVDNVFLEDAEITVAEEVLFEGLKFEAECAWHVTNGENTKVRQTGFGTDRGQFWIVNDDFVAWELVLPGFDGREGEIEASFGVIVGIARVQSHVLIVRVRGWTRQIREG